jgi:polyferredoxin
MEKTGRPKWLITWDTLADQAAKARGEHATFRFFRPRTIIYVSALALGTVVMATALIMRPGQGISVQHDRAPLFVRLADGSVRNGYTVKIVNKYQNQITYELRVQGMPNAALTEPDEALGPAGSLGLPVKADSVGTFRVLVAGQPAASAEGSQKLDFLLFNPRSGERTTYHSLFMSPPGRR